MEGGSSDSMAVVVLDETMVDNATIWRKQRRIRFWWRNECGPLDHGLVMKIDDGD